MSALRIHPSPYPSESIPGYAIRIASANGWVTVQEMYKDMGYRCPADISEATDKFIVALSKLTGKTAESIKESSTSQSLLDSHMVNTARCFSHLRQKTPKVCCECMKENTFINNDWTMIGFNHCIKHNTPLIQKCPACDELLTWHSMLLKLKCPSCSTHLKSEVVTDDSTYFSAITECGTSDRANMINDLFLAAQRIIRPYDSILETSKRPYANIDWSLILEQAYSLLRDKSTIIRWQRECVEARSTISALGTTALILPFTALVDELKLDWPIKHVGIAPLSETGCKVLSPEHTIKLTSKLRTEHTFSSERWRYHCDLKQLSLVLGIDEIETIKKLVDNGVFTPLKELQVFYKTLFQLDHFCLSYLKAGSNINSYHLVIYNDYAYLLPLFNITITDWITWLTKGSLIADLNNYHHTFVEAISPTKSSLQNHLVLSLQELKKTAISINSLCRFFSMTKTDARDLQASNVIKTYQQYSIAHVTGSDAVSLLQNFFVIPWLASCMQSSPNMLVKRFADKGVIVDLGKSFIFLSPKSYAVLIELLGQDSLLVNDRGIPLWIEDTTLLRLGLKHV